MKRRPAPCFMLHAKQSLLLSRAAEGATQVRTLKPWLSAPSYPASACLVDSASPNRLRLKSFAPRICSYSVDSRPVPRPRRV